MSVYNEAASYRRALLGAGPVSKASGTLSATTFPMFTVAGGHVLVTGFWLAVTTAITTDGGTLALNNDPSAAGDTATLIVATDLGTTDAVAGSLIGVGQRDRTAAPSFVKGGSVRLDAVAITGTINLVGAASVNGAVTAYATWIPLTDGATLVAA